MKKLIFLSILFLMSCSTTKMYPTEAGEAIYDKSPSVNTSLVSIEEKNAEIPLPSETKRKIIYNAQLTQEVDTVTLSKNRAMAIMNTYKGFMIQSTSNSISMRIPAEHLQNVLSDLRKIGKPIYENVNGQDVTDSYFDTKIRLENAEKTRNRYLELLNQAKDVSEILQVEKELERLNEKIDRFKGAIKNYDQQIAHSLVTVRFQTYYKVKKVRPGPLGYVLLACIKS